MNRRRYKEPVPEHLTVLPSEYQAVEYLRSVNGAYIDTNIPAYSANYILLKFRRTSITNYQSIMGARNDVYNKAISIWYPSEAGGQRIYFDYSDKRAYVTLADTNTHTLAFLNNNIYIDGEVKAAISNPIEFSDGYSLYLFSLNNAGAKMYNCDYVDIYSFAIGESQYKFKAYFVPCKRKSDNKPGMYDAVNNKFYTNAGTGDFLVGPDIDLSLDCDAPGELGYNNPQKAKFIGYKKVEDTGDENFKIVDRLWDYKRGRYNTITGEFIASIGELFLSANFPREWNGMHVTYNQLLQGADFANITDVSRYWTTEIGFVKSVEDGYVEVEKDNTHTLPRNAGVCLQQIKSLNTSHKYFLSAENVGNPDWPSYTGFQESHAVGRGTMSIFSNGYASAIMQPAIQNLYFTMRLGSQVMPNGETDKFTRPRMIDLTTFFKGNIPENLTAEQMTEYMPNLILEYNEGTECVIYNGDLYLAL